MSIISDASHPTAGAATHWLRVEGIAVLAISVFLYAQGEHGWILFLALLLVPDLSMVGYASGPRVGATVYNLAHTYTSPVLLALLGLLSRQLLIVDIALIWAAHIGMDRMLGYGLKLPDGFQHTHLGTIGRGKRPTTP